MCYKYSHSVKNTAQGQRISHPFLRKEKLRQEYVFGFPKLVETKLVVGTTVLYLSQGNKAELQRELSAKQLPWILQTRYYGKEKEGRWG